MKNNTYNKGGNTKEKQEPVNAGPIKIPKNIRQIGTIGTHNKVIYVEDYVMTFIKQLSGKDYTGCKVVVLLGYYIRTEECKNLFIKGAVEMKNTDFGNEITFSDEAWTSIYESIKKYFTDVEIVGWSLIGPEFFLEGGDRIRKIHIDNFSGPDKMLLKMDSMEKEEAFYLYENNQLVKQTGYYIYYEKNEEMQNYMVENKEVVMEENDYDDKTTKKIRSIIKDKKEPKEEKNVIRLLYAASTFLAVIVLVIGAVMLNNYGQLKNMETAINTISDNLRAVNSDKSQVVDVDKENNESKVADVSKEDETNIDDLENATESSKTEENGNNQDTSQADTKELDTMDVETVPGNLTVEEEANTETVEETAENEDKKEETTETTEESTKEPVNEDVATTNEIDATEEDEKDTEDAKSTVKEDPTPEEIEDESAETVAEVKYYVVQDGDSLVGISLKLYNSATYSKTIQELNGIEDENKILVGQKLIVP